MICTPKNFKSQRFESPARTPLRRSCNNSFATEPPVRDDENERKKRRSMAHLRQSMSMSTISEYSSGDEQEIKRHIEVCLKMFMENKITIKNAWNIKIIDYMRTFLQSHRLNNDSLQVGSTSLDVGARVYSIRVDDVHSTGIKLALSMSKMAHREQDNESRDDDDKTEQSETLNGAKKPARKKKKFTTGGVKHTIAKDVSSLLADVPKLNSATFQTKSNSELTLLDNFLTNRIPIDKSGCMFTLMSKDRLWTTRDDEDPSLSDRTFNLKMPPVGRINICPDFCEFEVDVWDPDNDEKENAVHNNDFVLDDRGVPMANLDGSIHDIFNEPHPADFESPEEDPETERIAILGEVTNVQDLRPNGAATASDYAYRCIEEGSKCVTNIWAGPSHWKFKYIERAVRRYSGLDEKKAPQERRSGKRREDAVINFGDDGSTGGVDGPVMNKKHLIKPWPAHNNFSVQVNRSMVLNTLRSLMTRPSITLYGPECSKNVDINQNDSHEESPYDYGNPDDSSYCPQNQGEDNHSQEEELAVAGQCQGYTGENLIDLPETVEENFISYATRAKKMDMKKLKACVWKILIDDVEHDIITEDMYKKTLKPTTFSKLYKALPAILNKSMREELSSSLAFVALLHLANEQNLELTGQVDSGDVQIKAADVARRRIS